MYSLQRIGMFHCYMYSISAPKCICASVGLAAFWTDETAWEWTGPAWQDLLQAVIRHRLFVPWLW